MSTTPSRAAGERKNDYRRIKVADLGKPGVGKSGGLRTDGVHLAHQATSSVEVVDAHIDENAARTGQELGPRGRHVALRGPEQVDITKFPGLHPLCRGRKSGVEAPVKTDLELDAGGVQRLNDLDRHTPFERKWLLTEHVLTCLSRAQSQLGVGISRRGDDDAVEGRIGQQLVIGGRSRRTQLGRNLLRDVGPRVENSQQLGRRAPRGQVLRMDHAHAAQPSHRQARSSALRLGVAGPVHDGNRD